MVGELGLINDGWIGITNASLYRYQRTAEGLQFMNLASL